MSIGILETLAARSGRRVRGGKQLSLPCPAHGGRRDNLSLLVLGDGLAAKCFSGGCAYSDIRAALIREYGVDIRPQADRSVS